MEQQEITVYAAITISGPLVYHLIRWNVGFSSVLYLQQRHMRGTIFGTGGFANSIHYFFAMVMMSA
jgi:hypothetical protein